MEATTSSPQQYQQKSPSLLNLNTQNICSIENRQTTNGYIPNNLVATSSLIKSSCFYDSSSMYTSNINENSDEQEEETTLMETNIENTYTQPCHNITKESFLQINNITSPRFVAISRNCNKKAQEVAALHAAIKDNDEQTTIENDEENCEQIRPYDQRLQQIGTNDADADAEVSETLLNSMEALPQTTSPIKFQILNYVANTTQLHIRRTGSELQVFF